MTQHRGTGLLLIKVSFGASFALSSKLDVPDSVVNAAHGPASFHFGLGNKILAKPKEGHDAGHGKFRCSNFGEAAWIVGSSSRQLDVQGLGTTPGGECSACLP